MDRVTRIHYGLMGVFGVTCIGTALAPLQQDLQIAAISVTFGITIGLWVSHLIIVLARAGAIEG